MKVKEIITMLIPGNKIYKKIYYRYKISHLLYIHGLETLAKISSYRLYRKYHCYISEKAELGKNVIFPHPIGIVIGEGTKIGDNCVIYQNVTLGRKDRKTEEYPIIEDNVIIYCNATLIGNITIGKNSIIGCNSVILKSVEKNSKCVGVVK